MSSRQRRLVQQQREDAWLQAKPDGTQRGPSEEDDEGGSGEETPAAELRISSNPYGLLEAENDSEDDRTSEREEEKSEAAGREANDGNELNGGKKTKRKKKKKKNKKRDEKKEDDDIDQLLNQINAADDSATKQGGPSISDRDVPNSEAGAKDGADVFALTVKSLKGDEELNRMFGAKVVASVEAELRQKNRRDPRRREPVTGRHGSRRFIRNFVFSAPQPEWSIAESGLSMISKGESDGGEVFEYVTSEAYQSVQAAFRECQELGDPNLLGVFVERHPFHVEALLAMHDLLLATGSHIHAEECLHRALFALEVAWHRKFSATSGRCHLLYEVESNRPFFVAIFSHVQHLNRRGCLKVAFECCKFLLSLDASDPKGALCMIDYLAIRAGRFEFVEQLIEGTPEGSSIATRPGIAFSVALCKFKQEKRADAIDRSVQAVLMYPLVVVRLIRKLEHVGVRQTQQSKAVLSQTLFSQALESPSASLNHLINLFVERHHLLYKPQDVLEWLLEGSRLAAECVTEGETFQGIAAEDWRCACAIAFPPDPVNHFRHLHLYDFSDEVNRVPEDVLRGEGDGEALAEVERRMAQELERHGGIEGIVHLREEDLRNANPLIVFLRSLLPWVQAEREDHDPRDNH